MNKLIRELLIEIKQSENWAAEDAGHELFFFLEMQCGNVSIEDRQQYSVYGINRELLILQISENEILEIALCLESLAINSNKDLSQMFPLVMKLPKDIGNKILGNMLKSRVNFSTMEIKQALWAIDTLNSLNTIVDCNIRNFLHEVSKVSMMDPISPEIDLAEVANSLLMMKTEDYDICNLNSLDSYDDKSITTEEMKNNLFEQIAKITGYDPFSASSES